MSKLISTTMTPEDYFYCKNHNLKFSHLLKMAIRDHKVHIGAPDAEPTLREMATKIQKLGDLLSRTHLFIENKGLLDDKEYKKIFFIKQ